MTRAANIGAIETTTGRTWDAWQAALEGAGGGALDHGELAHAALAIMPPALDNPQWWAQTVAVAYEQEIGRRVPGQRADGTFQPSASRTLNLGLDEAFAAWLDLVEDRDTFADIELAAEPTSTATDRYRRWRAPMEDGTRLGAAVAARADRSVITVTWYGLADPATRDERKEWISSLLAALP
jgi:hypothetical protein